MTDLLMTYLADLSKLTNRGDATEQSYYSTLKDLFEEGAKQQKRKIDITTLPKRTEAGNPDFRVWDGKHKHVGYIEAKVPEENLDKIERSDQLERYRSTFPNVLLTNFYEFRLYRDGELVNNVQIGRPFVAKKLGAVAPLENAEKFTQLLTQFFDFSVPSLTHAKFLALELAKRTRFLRDQVIREELKPDAETKDLLGFYEAFRKHLIASLSEEDFADLYAQTITYGLFIARHRFDTTPNLFDRGIPKKIFTRELAYELIPPTLGILQDVFHFLSSSKPPKQLQVIIEDIAEVLASADLKKIEEEFFHAKRGRDPIVHFYETFLAHYDPAKREQRGVYYTPEPVVNYIVRSLHHLLKEEFGKPDGFASQGVTVLDPAAGTQTFPATAMYLAAEEYTEKYGKGGLDQLIRDHILKDFYAFELMMAPYAIGHLKIAYVLEELGYHMKEDERFQLYLTNTLDLEKIEQTNIPHVSSLSEESKEAAEVKNQKKIMVIMGNPPYSVSSTNIIRKNTDLSRLLESYKERVRIEETNIQPLSDDYIKFLAFAHWKILQNEEGVIGMITNNSFLDGIIHRDIRRKMLHDFDQIYVVNLHGSTKKKEMTPDGKTDKNVFAIQQGVSITLLMKRSGAKKHIYYCDIWGDHEQKKYDWLEQHTIEDTSWMELQPHEPYFFLVPRQDDHEEWQRFVSLKNIFSIYKNGIQTGHDEFAVDIDRQAIKARMIAYTKSSTSNEEIAMLYDLKSKSGWNFESERQKAITSGYEDGRLVPYSYRPFDLRWIYFSKTTLKRPVMDLMQSIYARKNLVLCVTRQLSQLPFNHAFVTTNLFDMCFVSLATKETAYGFPLYTSHSGEEGSMFVQDQEEINFSKHFIESLESVLAKKVSPLETFSYIYATLCAPSYRERYVEELKIDFPRIPITSNAKLFAELAKLGQELVDLHLLKSKKLEKPIAKFEGSGEAKVEARKYDEKKKTVRINDHQCFTGIPPEVWNYHVGGYQVLDKWLKDRRGRILSSEDIRHYCRVATALAETIKVQREIDEVIELRGGWPIK